MSNNGRRNIAVVITAYRAVGQVMGVVAAIGEEVSRIYVVDDCCPEGSGRHVEKHCVDPRVFVIYNAENLGVGGAVMAGYVRAVEDGAEVIVKIDGDGQMDPGILSGFVEPILSGRADYTKGNRFYDLRNIQAMPSIRIFGNAALSFMTKLSTGYWNNFDPTNGYTAIHANVVRLLPLEKISKRYFFETDMLFRLGTFRAVVRDVAMDAKYEDEESNLKISRILGEFLMKHVKNFFKRLFYTYYLRDMSIASIELPLGLGMFLGGVIFGGIHWLHSIQSGVPASAGTVVLAALPIIVGLQFLLGFLGYDIESVPKEAIHQTLGQRPRSITPPDMDGGNGKTKSNSGKGD
jgi:glycosyltransferase involved in cell wall biosynthesis